MADDHAPHREDSDDCELCHPLRECDAFDGALKPFTVPCQAHLSETALQSIPVYKLKAFMPVTLEALQNARRIHLTGRKGEPGDA